MVSKASPKLFNKLIAFAPSVPASYKLRPVIPATPANPATQFLITTGEDQLVLSDNNGNYVAFNNLNIVVDRAVAGLNGLAAGITIANSSWYALLAISNGTTCGALIVGSDISATTLATLLPSGYTFRKLIGWLRTGTAADFLRLGYNGKTAFYIPTASTNTGTYPSMGAGSANYAVAAFVPSTALEIDVFVSAGAGGNNTSGTNSMSGTSSASSGGGWSGVGFASQIGMRLPLEAATTATSTISAYTSYGMTCRGWIDSI